MKKLAAAFAGSVLLLLVGCNVGARNDEVLARVGGTTLMQSELDLALATIPPERRNDSTAATQVFASLLDSRIFAEAAKRALPGSAKDVESRLATLRQRDLAHTFQQYYVTENYGHTDDQLYVWFRKHEKEFPIDSLTKAKPNFEAWKDSVAVRMTLSEQAKVIEDYFEKNKAQFKTSDSANVGVIKAKDSLALVKVIEAYRNGAKFDSLATTHNDDSSLVARKGHIGWIYAARGSNDLREIVPAFDLIFGKAKLATGSISNVLPFVQHVSTDSTKMFAAIVVFDLKTMSEPTMQSVGARVKSYWLGEYKQKLGKMIGDSLKNALKFVDSPIPPADQHAFYEKHKGEYLTQKTYKLLHIEGSDSAKLAALVANVKTEDEFRAKAKTASENLITRDKGGDLGLVKVAHCLPSGLGMMPELFSKLENQKQGSMTPVIVAPDSKKFEVFWLLESIAPQVMSYERAQKQVLDQIKSSPDSPLDSNFVLVTLNGIPAIREVDVLKLREEVPPNQQRMYPREKLLSFLKDWALYSHAALDLGLDKSREFKAICNLRSADAWATIYRDSIQNRTLGYDLETLRKAFISNPEKLFDGKTFERSTYEAALWLDIPDAPYIREYALHPERYPNTKTWQEAKVAIFRNIRDAEQRGAQIRLRFRLKRELNVEVLDPKYASSQMSSAVSILNMGKTQYEHRQLADARAMFQVVRDAFSTDTSAFRASLLTAQTFSEEENFNQALEEYKALLAQWPKHPEVYKALFMKGFILSENLKKDSLALDAFQELQTKYPKSDLSEDADWMIRNIKSGGKLAPALLDSIAKQDSLQAKKPTGK